MNCEALSERPAVLASSPIEARRSDVMPLPGGGGSPIGVDREGLLSEEEREKRVDGK